MFGKPDWFAKKKCGWGLKPVTSQGWLWTGFWLAAIALPCLGLLAAGKAPEAGLWLVAALGLLFWEVRGMMRKLDDAEASNVLYIKDDNADRLATRKYDMHLRE